MDRIGKQPVPYWELDYPVQLHLLRYGLSQVLALVTRDEIGRPEFAQELALDLSRLPETETVLFERKTRPKTRTKPKREGFPVPINDEHSAKFRWAQKDTFLRLIAPYRWKKRQERVIPYADERWVLEDGQSVKRRLERPDDDTKFMGEIPASGNSEEEAYALHEPMRGASPTYGRADRCPRVRR